ncbi:MAG: acyl-CoA thioesterase [Polyangiaceae bacterium]
MRPLFSAERAVLFQDIDAAGIVFYARIFDYCHDAFFAFLAARGLSMPKVVSEGVWGSPIVHAEANYLSPLRFGDRMRVQIMSVQLGGASMRVTSRIVDFSGNVACSVSLVHAFVDCKTVKARPVPAEVRDALEDWATS